MDSVIIRPKIDWKNTIVHILISVATAISIGILLGHIAEHFGIREAINSKLVFICYLCMWKIRTLEGRISVLALIIEMIIFIKPIVIWLVRFYQRYAPESIRNECLFEPSCSNYMIMAIEKYGFLKGFIKGVKRLRRCHQPNGGIDYP